MNTKQIKRQHYRQLYSAHQTHDSLDALNLSVQLHTDLHGRTLTKTSQSLLKLISRHSCVVLGVSWLKVDTMAIKLNVSTRTIKRCLKQLTELNIISRTVLKKSCFNANIVTCSDLQNVTQAKCRQALWQ